MSSIAAPAASSGRLRRTTDSAQRRGAHLRTLLWFLRDGYRVARRPMILALVSELGAFVLQAAAFTLLATTLSSPETVLEDWGRQRAAVAVGAVVVVVLLIAEILKYYRQALKNRVGYHYEIDALRRVLRYASPANRFDSETIKNLASRLPQVSARVAMVATEIVVPIAVIIVAGGFVLWQYPWFALVFVFGLVAIIPMYFVVVRRGRVATTAFYSVEGLDYARNAALAFSPNSGGISIATIHDIPNQSQRSLKALEVRRSTPNLTYLVTGTATAVTLAGLAGYAVLRSDNGGSLLHLLVLLQFSYMGIGRLTSAVSKSQILLPRVEPVVWALRSEPPPAPRGTTTTSGPSVLEDLFDD